MSRTIKAIKLLHILKDTFNREDDYIKVSELVEELDTDDRNIRRIVRLLNDSLNINIVSRTGRDGGYRLTTDIYDYFLGVSYDDLDALEVAKDTMLKLKAKTMEQRQAITAINKINDKRKLKRDKEDQKYNGNLVYDIDYLIYLEQVKQDQYAFDLNISEELIEPFHIKIKYRTTKSYNELNVISLGNYTPDGYESFIVLDLDSFKVRYLELKYIQYTEMVYGDVYDYQSIFSRIQNGDFVETAIQFNDLVLNKYFAEIKIVGKLCKESKRLLRTLFGEYIYQFEDSQTLLINRTRIPTLFMFDIPELLDSRAYYSGPIKENEIHDKFKSLYNFEGTIELNEKYYAEYMKQYEINTKSEDIENELT